MHAAAARGPRKGIVYADLDLGMISLAKAAADPAGHYARPDVTRLLLDKTPGDRVVVRSAAATEVDARRRRRARASRARADRRRRCRRRARDG